MPRAGVGCVGASLACCAGVAFPCAWGASYRVVAHHGMVAPGGGWFMDLSAPALSDDGRVAFRGYTSEAGAGSGVFTDVNGAIGELQAVIAEGANVPGLVGTTFGSVAGGSSLISMNASGDFALCARIDGVQTAYADFVMVRHRDGQTAPVGVPGQLVPLPCEGFSCQRWFTDLVGVPAINADGQVVFNGTIDGTGVDGGNDSVLVMGDPDGLGVVLREGDESPWAGLNFGEAASEIALLSDAGIVGVRNIVTTADLASDFWAVWRGPGDAIAPAAAEGWATPEGGSYTGDVWGTIAMNGVGDLMFGQESIIDGVEKEALWLRTGSGVEAVCIEGDPAPMSFTQYADLDAQKAQVNNAGQVVFPAELEGFNVDGSNNDAILLREPDGSTVVVVREGDQAPGLPVGVAFGDAPTMSPVLTEGGRVVFRHRLMGPGVNDGNDDTLWITRVDGSLELLLREGDSLFIQGEWQDIEGFSYLRGMGQGSGIRGAVNEHGQVAVRAAMGGNALDTVLVITPSPDCAGDVNGDGVVDSLDLNLLLAGFGSVGEPGAPGDFDLDGDIDSEDLNQVLVNFGDLCLSQS